MNGEIEKIIARYEKRKNLNEKSSFFATAYTLFERELFFKRLIYRIFGHDLTKLKILEIGAGAGDNLLFFHRLGFRWENIFANELLPDRGVRLIENLGRSQNVNVGNALDLDFQNEFDIVFQSLVFTSILDSEFRKKLAEKMFLMTRNNGIILFYDFKYNNPQNKDVKRVSRKEIRLLFENCKIDFYNVTLAPPISRRVGRYYSFVNFFFPFLRTHLIAVIHKSTI